MCQAAEAGGLGRADVRVGDPDLGDRGQVGPVVVTDGGQEPAQEDPAQDPDRRADVPRQFVGIRARHDQERHRHVGTGGAGAGVAPVDDDRAAGSEHDVAGVQVHVNDPVTGANRMPHSRGRGDLVQPVVQVREQAGVPTRPPRAAGQVVQHGRAGQPLHNQLLTVRAEHLGHRVAGLPQVAHQVGLGFAAMGRPVPAEHAAAVQGVDVGGAAAANQLMRFPGRIRHVRHYRGRAAPRPEG